MAEQIALPAWMGDTDPSRIGFPFEPDRRRYRKRTGITYKETPLGPLLLDSYRPAEGGAHPLVVMIHGGAWCGGGRFQMGLTRWAGYLATGGLAVVSIDYRLAPAAHYPDSFQDCLDAVDWAVEHAAEIGCDPERIGLWGDSAGGHLALLLATSQTNPAFSGPRMRTPAGRLGAVVAWYPPTDLLALHRAAARGPTPRIVLDFVGIEPEVDPERWREASPSEQLHAAMPPALVLQGTRDFLVPYAHTVRFSEKLAAAGIEHEFHLVDGALHGFDRVAPCERARALIVHSRDFLCERLGLPPPPAEARIELQTIVQPPSTTST
jgi:acetyl esterase/lipase